MKKYKILALCAVCLATLTLAAPDFADAARLGGGRSFGSSSIMRRPAAPPSGSFQRGSSVNRQAPLAANRADGGAAAIPRSNTGLFSGLFGGLLAGTMLGSLFGGSGMAGGMMGGFMNLLLLGLLVYFGVRMFRRFTSQPSPRNEQSPRTMNYSNTAADSRAYGQGGSVWDSLLSQPQDVSAQQQAQPGLDIPADFNEEEFLRGAKLAYTRMQDSWDRRDLDDIAAFATEDVMQKLRKHAQEDPNPGKTELLLVNASILEVREEDSLTRVAVYFDVIMREDQNAKHPEQVREIWHFVCSRKDGDSWKLDGIQQLA